MIMVCWDCFCFAETKLLENLVAIHLYKKLDREVGALQKVAKFLKADKCIIVTYDQEDTLSLKGMDQPISVVPIYKFLLSDPF
ncbi:MAG: hypothetical protein ACI30I_01200 [Parabacteroides sp.]